MVIDSHVHFWKYDKVRDAWITKDMQILREDYLPHTLSSTLKRNGVEGCVAVQADQSELETLFLYELSQTYPIIKGVVGWIDLLGDEVQNRLAYFAQYPVVKGFRHIVQAESDGFLLNQKFINNVALLHPFGFTYDILVMPHQLKDVISFVDKLPEQKMVIDHLAKPYVKKKEIEAWKKDIQIIAQNPNIYCKLSGLFTEAHWKEWHAADFYPYLDVVFEAFGTDRLMFGSDWPVMLLSGMYVQWKSLLEKYMEQLEEEERIKVMGTNAIQFYNL
ncbi:MAG: amidohydrolase [Chitinophagaceae bacterium]|nr:MAG: amidohydrolase [Chitinophagaceae bacterium]